MNFIDKLERKFPRFGIPNLMRYVIGINIAGAILGLLDSFNAFGVPIYANYLSLDFYQIGQGQVWRLITFILYPVYDLAGRSAFINLIWFALWAYLYLMFGTALERAWGKFRFTLFYIGGVIFIVLVTLVFYLINSSIYGPGSSQLLGYVIGYSVTFEYLNETVFLAYALLMPNMQFLLYFVIPIKAKWLAYVSLALLGFNFVMFIIKGQYYGIALIAGAMLNFCIFYFLGRGKQNIRGQYEQRKRRQEFHRAAGRPYEPTGSTGGTLHKCAICGRTERDDPRLEFRYCSKCNGSYEYCSDHLFSHTHVQ